MTDYHDKGFSVVDLMDPKFAANAWLDLDPEEIRKLLDKTSDMPWKILLNVPKTQRIVALSQELDKNMWKCWERYGKKTIKPNIVEEDFRVFLNLQNIIETSSAKQYVMIFVPLITVSNREGLPSLMGGSHRTDAGVEHKPYDLVVQPGQALMLNAQLTIRLGPVGGGVLLARAYDVTGM